MQNGGVFTDPVTIKVYTCSLCSCPTDEQKGLPHFRFQQLESMTLSTQEEEHNEPCDPQTLDNTKNQCNTYLILSLYVYILTALISFVFLALLFLTVVILILPRYDGTISMVGGQLTHVVEETAIVTSTELISFLEQDRSKIPHKLQSRLDTIQNSIRRYDHSPTSSPVPSEYWNKYGNDCPKLESAAPQSQQTATMCSIYDTQVCPLVQNLPLDHCGSSNKMESKGQKDVTQFSAALLPLPNTTLNSSVAEKQEIWWFYPVYYLLSMIIRYVFDTSTLILLLLLLMPILCILSTPTEDVFYMANRTLPSDSPATVQLSPEPPVDDNDNMGENITPESNVSQAISEGNEDVPLAQSAFEQQQLAPFKTGATETKTVYDHSKDCDQMLNSPTDLIQQSTTWNTPPQDLTEVTSMHNPPKYLVQESNAPSQDRTSMHSTPSRISTDSSTDVEESSISEVEPDSEDDDESEIWETPMCIVCSEESEPTDVVGIQKPYLFPPAVEIKGRISDSYESTTAMEQPFQPFQQQENEEDPGLRTEDWDTQVLPEHQHQVQGSLLIPGGVPTY